MKLNITAHIKQHAGDMLSECQDSFDFNIDKRTFAVADGVSQAFRPELWSRLLTHHFVNNPEDFFVTENQNFLLNPNLNLKKRWEELVERAYEDATENERFLLDMKRESINIGASTFIGLQFDNNGIKYFTIGDSVLFFYSRHTRELEIISSMIGEEGSLAFNNSPEYIDTNEQTHGKIITGYLKYEDGIILMATDALSDWMVEQQDKFELAFNRLIQCKSHKEYDLLINDLRLGKQLPKLKDDDTTFIAIEISDSNSMEIIPEISFAETFENLIQNEAVIELKKRTEQYETAQVEISRLESSVRRNEKALKNLEREKSLLAKELKKEKECHTTLQDKYSTLINEKAKSTKELETQLTSLRSVLDKQKKESQEKKNELESATRQYDRNEKSLRRQIDKLNEEIKELRSQKASSVDKVDKQEMIALQTQLNTAMSSKSKVLQQLEEITKLLEQIKLAYDASHCCLTNYDALLTLLNFIPVDSQMIEVSFIEKQNFDKSTGDGGFQFG